MIEIPVDEVIPTPRCRLRYPEGMDIPYIWSASREPGFNDGMRWDPPKDMAELEEPLRNSQRAWADGVGYAWTVEGRGHRTFIGRISIRRESAPDAWSIGFWTHPSQQRRGYAVEAAIAVVEFGFRRLDAEVITAAHATWNEASRKVLERAGMKLVRLNLRGFRKNGKWVEEYEYEMRRASIDLDQGTEDIA